MRLDRVRSCLRSYLKSGWFLFLCGTLAVLFADVLSAQTVGQSSAPLSPGPAEPWILEGDSLWGGKERGSEVTRPVILHGPLRIEALHGRIPPGRNVLVLTGAVRIRDTLGVVTSEKGIYRKLDRVLDLIGRVEGHGPNGDFRAGALTYDRGRSLVHLRESPQVSDSTRVIWADRIEFDDRRRRGRARGNVRVLLRADSTWINGQRADYDERTGEIRMTGDPWLYRPGLSEDLDLTVHADTLEMNELEREGFARGNVKIQRGEVRASSGRADFELIRNRMLLTDEPVSWDTEGEIRADTMSLRLQTGASDRLRAYGGVSVDYRPLSSPGEVNFVLGDTLDANLSAGRVRDLSVKGKAVSLYLPNIDDMRTGTGRNLGRAREIRLSLSEGAAERVDFISEASGAYQYPSDSALRNLRDPVFLDSLQTAEGVDLFSGIDGRFRERVDTLAVRSGAEDSLFLDRPDIETYNAELDSLFEEPGGLVSGAEPSPEIPEGDWSSQFLKPIDPLLSFFRENQSLELPDSLQGALQSLFTEEVRYEGDTIRFYIGEDQLSLRGRGKMSYQGNALESEEIDYYASREEVVALGDPTLRDDATQVVGTRMVYHTDEREGFVYQGKTELEGGFYYGEVIKKLSDDALLVQHGRYTTCSHDPPHFYFQSRRMKVMKDDKVIARPIILKIRDVPIMAIPYYLFPAKSGRRSGIMFPELEFGFNRNRGRFIEKLGYYWAINDYMDTKAWFDYFDDGPEYKFSGDFRYKQRYVLDGQVSGSYLNDKSGTSDRRRWEVRGNHSHELGDNADISVRGNFVSDAQYVEDTDLDAGVDERLNRQLDSSASFSQRWSRASLNVNGSRTQYLDEDAGGGLKRTEQLPSIRLSVNSFALGREGDEFGRGGRLSPLASTTARTGFVFEHRFSKRFDGEEVSNTGAEATWGLQDTRKLGPFLRLTPSLSGDVAWFEKDALGDVNQVGATWTSSLRAASTVYGTWSKPVGILAGLRHVVEPSVDYRYQPEFDSLSYTDSTGIERNRFDSVGSVSLSGSESSRMGFSLDQRIHTKWRRGDDIIKKENVLTLRSSTSYDFLAEGSTKPLGQVSNSVRFEPFSALTTSYSFTIDPYEWTNERFSVRTNLAISSRTFARKATADSSAIGQDEIKYGEVGQVDRRDDEGLDPGQSQRGDTKAQSQSAPWNLALVHSYSGSRGVDRRTNRLNADVSLSPTRAWSFAVGGSYDFDESEFVEHNFKLSRDLHCWELTFRYNSRGTYFFHVGIRDIPDIKYDSRK